MEEKSNNFLGIVPPGKENRRHGFQLRACDAGRAGTGDEGIKNASTYRPRGNG